MGENARSSIIVRLVSMLSVGAVAVALLVGFFFGGDFQAAFDHVTGLGLTVESGSRERGEVEVIGTARIDGRCSNEAVADMARKAASQQARSKAADKCRELPGAGAEFAIKQLEGDPILKETGGKCHASHAARFSCLFGAP